MFPYPLRLTPYSLAVLLWTNHLVKLKFPCRTDLDHDGTFDGIPGFPVEGHLAGDPVKFLDLGQLIPDGLPILLHVPCQPTVF